MSSENLISEGQSLENLPLESLMKRLAEIVRSLEQNDVMLEDSLKLFEEGVSITRICHSKLTQAEKKIEILSRVSPEGVETRPFQS